MFNKFILMSLATLLFGCKSKPKKGEPYPEIPHFPAMTSAVLRADTVVFPQGLFPHTYTISPDKERVFVLTYNLEDPTESMVYTVVALDPNGKVLRRVDLPRRSVAIRPCFFWEDDGMVTLILSDEFITFDPETLGIRKKIRIFHDENFLKQKELDELTPYYLNEAYNAAVEKAISKSRSVAVRTGPRSSFAYMMLDKGKSSPEVWQACTDETLAKADSAFVQLDNHFNPGSPIGLNRGELQAGETITDGPVSLTFFNYSIYDTVLDYPNYKNIEARYYEIITLKGRARFKVSNKGKRQYYLPQYADNHYLTTKNGAVWMAFEEALYIIR